MILIRFIEIKYFLNKIKLELFEKKKSHKNTFAKIGKHLKTENRRKEKLNHTQRVFTDYIEINNQIIFVD